MVVPRSKHTLWGYHSNEVFVTSGKKKVKKKIYKKKKKKNGPSH
jgi:hypothetical protein